jgi:hypothetical protein
MSISPLQPPISPIIGRQDPSLSARVVATTPLLYRAGPDTAADRPGHVRAGSSLAFLGRHLAVIQDDANFIAWFDPADSQVEVVPLPAGHEGKRLFGDDRGNKQWKLDLEACLVDGDRLVAFGSGSSPLRERLVIITDLASDRPDVIIHDASAFYAALRAATDFAGSELNIEGAILLDADTLRLFQRGNGAPHDHLLPVNATADLSWSNLLAYLHKPQPAPTFPLNNIRQYNLGTFDGIPLTFTDAAVAAEAILFSAAAEASPDAIQDGPVAGSVLGVIAADGAARWTPLLDDNGRPFAGKVEGIARSADALLYVIIDKDDPATPSELCRVELIGSWPLTVS